MDSLLGIAGAAVLGLIGWFVLRMRSPRDDQPVWRPGGPSGSAARREEIRRSEEAKVRDKLKKVDDRPSTGDAAADLEARLGGGAANGDGPGKPAA